MKHATRRRRTASLAVFALVLAVSAGSPAACASVNFSGTWAVLKVLSDTATFPLVGQLDRTTTLVQRVSIAQSGTSLAMAATYCAATFDNGPALVTTLDQAFLCSLPPIASSAAIDAALAGFSAEWTTEVHGVRLERPDVDPLPTSASDPRVFDQDADGKPGITVHARALGAIVGDVYVIQRLRTRLEGRVISADRIEGQVEGAVEQVILGASTPLFLGSIVSRPDTAAEHNAFVLVRVSSLSTCDDILARRLELFGLSP